MSVKKLFGKVEIKHEPVTVSDTRKVDLSIMAFQVTLFCSPMFGDFKKRQKNEQYYVSPKNVTCKNFELSKWTIFVSKTAKKLQNSEVFKSPISCLLLFTIFRAQKFHM